MNNQSGILLIQQQNKCIDFVCPSLFINVLDLVLVLEIFSENVKTKAQLQKRSLQPSSMGVPPLPSLQGPLITSLLMYRAKKFIHGQLSHKRV